MRPADAARRADVLAALARIDPVDRREVASLHEVRTGLRDLPRPFDQAAGPVHLTVSAVIAGRRGTVLHLHKRLGLWLQPGGHLDAGEDPADGALREAEEETGLAVRHPPAGPLLFHVDAHDGGRGHRHLDLRYLLLAGDDDPDPPAGESQACRWFDWADATAVADPGLTGALVVARTLATQVRAGD